MLLNKPKQKIRYAVVGLGYIAQTAVLPAFKNAKSNSKLVALISGDKEKLKRLGDKYKVDKCYLYSEFEQCLRNDEIDAIYITTPNFYHRNIMETAARFGVHVLCEKPMAVTAEDCLSMINEAEKNNVQLMVAYRLHFEAANLEAIKLAQSKRIGDMKIFNSVFTMQVEDRNNIRLQEDEKGGGPLYDIGIYCINAARYLFKSEPMEVFAMTASSKDSRFKKTEESVSVVMKFPDEKLATFSISFGAFSSSDFELIGTKGRIRLEKAYEYSKTMSLKIYEEKKIITKKYPKRDQFAPEIIYFSDCIQRKKRPEPSGEEGLADIKIIEALLLSIDLGSPIKIDEVNKRQRPTEGQKITRPSIPTPRLFNATGPGGNKH
ncbi:MAG TPA: Gfo/Idh/MocA family oxidoreductase [Bacteriovoracaceae bacterium]|nr:Gfo/Idh/MocA family oxidoreductase [Bacteriovoracaceae bacterium]